MYHGASSITDRLCFSFSSTAFYALMDGGAEADATSALAEELILTQMVPQEGWHFMIVRFRDLGGSWQASAQIRKPDGIKASTKYVCDS